MNRRRRRSSRSTESGVRDDARARDEGPHRRPKSRSRRASVTRERRVGSLYVAIAFSRKSASSGAIDEDTTPASIDRAVDRSIARSSRGRSRDGFAIDRSIARGANGARTRRADGDDGDDAGVGGSAQGCATDGERDRARARGAERARCARDATRRDHPTTRAIRARRDHPTTRRDATRRDGASGRLTSGDGDGR